MHTCTRVNDEGHPQDRLVRKTKTVFVISVVDVSQATKTSVVTIRAKKKTSDGQWRKSSPQIVAEWQQTEDDGRGRLQLTSILDNRSRQADLRCKEFALQLRPSSKMGKSTPTSSTFIEGPIEYSKPLRPALRFHDAGLEVNSASVEFDLQHPRQDRTLDADMSQMQAGTHVQLQVGELHSDLTMQHSFKHKP